MKAVGIMEVTLLNARGLKCTELLSKYIHTNIYLDITYSPFLYFPMRFFLY